MKRKCLNCKYYDNGVSYSQDGHSPKCFQGFGNTIHEAICRCAVEYIKAVEK